MSGPQIRLTVLGITQILCDQIAVDLTESAARVVREGTWDELVWELVSYDDQFDLLPTQFRVAEPTGPQSLYLLHAIVAFISMTDEK